MSFEAIQTELPQSTGRQTSRNFYRTGGQRFRIENGVLPPGDVGFLASDSLVLVGEPAAPTNTEAATPCPHENRALEDSLGRAILNCWEIAFYDTATVRLYEFASKGTSHLASLVLDDGGHMIRSDFESETPDSVEVWREGDDGHIQGDAFKILFIIKGKAGIFMAYSWGAEEGEDLMLIRCPPGRSTFQDDASAYRYWFPG